MGRINAWTGNCSHEIGWDDTPTEKQNLKPHGADHKDP